MKLKNNTYYYLDNKQKVIIIGVNKYESRILLIAPEDNQKVDWMCEINSFYTKNFKIKDKYKDRKFMYAVHELNLTKL